LLGTTRTAKHSEKSAYIGVHPWLSKFPVSSSTLCFQFQDFRQFLPVRGKQNLPVKCVPDFLQIAAIGLFLAAFDASETLRG
jgi:hypothetical protein